MPRDDPNAGVVPYGKDYVEVDVADQRLAMEHLGGTVMDSYAPNDRGLSPWYLEIVHSGGEPDRTDGGHRYRHARAREKEAAR